METFHARFAPFPYHPPRALAMKRARVTDFTAIVTIRLSSRVFFFFSPFFFFFRGGQVNLERSDGVRLMGEDWIELIIKSTRDEGLKFSWDWDFCG